MVRPRTNIAELDEDRFAFSGHASPSAMSDISDVEEFRGKTPEPDYADTSPRKLSLSSHVKSEGSAGSVSVCSDLNCDDVEKEVPVIVVNDYSN